MGLFTRRESQEKVDNYLRKFIDDSILFDGKDKREEKKTEEESEESESNKGLKGNSGITMIILVVTMIVMLILLGIAMQTAFSDNEGVIKLAKQSRSETVNRILKEETKKNILNESTQYISESANRNVVVTLEQYLDQKKDDHVWIKEKAEEIRSLKVVEEIREETAAGPLYIKYKGYADEINYTEMVREIILEIIDNNQDSNVETLLR